MTYKADNLEIYLKNCSASDILSWITDIFGIGKKVQDGQDIAIYHFNSTGNQIALTITENMNNESFTSIFISPNHTPWSNDVEFARAANHKLGCVVRCDPSYVFPEIDPQSDTFLQIIDSKEEFIDWN